MEYADIFSSKKSLILHINGYLYSKSAEFIRRYWRCRKQKCRATAITVGDGEFVVIIKGPKISPHNHPPNYETAEIQRKVHCTKGILAEYPVIPTVTMPVNNNRELNARDKVYIVRPEPSSNKTKNDRPNMVQECHQFKNPFNCSIPILVALKDMEKWDQLKKN